MYCDDAVLRALIKSEEIEVSGLSTTGLLRIADDEGLVSPSNVAALLAQMVSWNVGIEVDNRYLVASLEGAVQSNTKESAAARLALIEKHEPFTVLFRALTYPGKGPSELVQHMGALLTDMLKSDQSEVESVTAVVSFWFNRVRMFPTAGELGWRLLGYPVVYALTALPESAAHRVIGVMRTAVELCVGERQMSPSIEAEIPVVLGEIAGSLARRDQQLGESVRRKLLGVMPLRTVDGDRCFAAYTTSQQHHVADQV